MGFFFFFYSNDRSAFTLSAGEGGRLLWSRLYAVRLRALENNANAAAAVAPLIIFIVNQRVVFLFSSLSFL